MAGTYEIPLIGSSNETQEPKIKTMLEGLNNKLNSSNLLEGSGIANEAIKSAQISPGTVGRFYAPTIIATEQERESTSFGTLTTKDEVTNVVLPTNGLIVVYYLAVVKSSVSASGRAAIFLNENQLKTVNSGSWVGQETPTIGTAFATFSAGDAGLSAVGENPEAQPTTGAGFGVGSATSRGAGCAIFAAAGTYNISVRFKALSGKITAKERRLYVGVIGA